MKQTLKAVKAIIFLFLLFNWPVVCAQQSNLVRIQKHEIVVTLNLKGGQMADISLDSQSLLKQTCDENFLRCGSTLWIAPQTIWNWPPPQALTLEKYEIVELLPNAATLKSNKIRLKNKKGKFTNIIIEKQYIISPDTSLVYVNYKATNVGKNEIQMALWENTRLPFKGEVIVPGPTSEPYGKKSNLLTVRNEDYYLDYQDENDEGKIFFQTSEKGQIIYQLHDVQLTKFVPKLNDTEVAPNQGNIELYVEGVNQFLEIESQGAYNKLKPGKSMSYKVIWSLNPISSN